jgi:predicted membrane protein
MGHRDFMTTGNYNPIGNPRFVIGAGIALFGIVLMLDRLHIVDADLLLRFWPVIFIAIGVQRFLNPREGRSNVQGVLWMAFGGWLLLNTLGAFRVPVWEMIWPVILIWFGAHLMQRTTAKASDATAAAGGTFGGSVSPADTIFSAAVMSTVKTSNNSSNFRGGEVYAFMGGGQIDLRQATIPPGAEAIIDVIAFMGGFEIFVPPHWVIATPIVPFMGGVEDKRLAPPPGTADVAGQAAPRLALRGFVMMGGVTVRS